MSTLIEYFDAAYLINLPQRVDRLKSAKKQLARVGWNIGPNGVQIFPARSFAERAGFPNAGARGCFHSHLDCLRRSHSENRRNVLMLEDDIALSSLLYRQTSLILSQLADLQWDFVYFGHEATGDILRANSSTIEAPSFQPWIAEIHTTHCYGISNRILPRLIAHLEHVATGTEGDHEYGPMPLDGAYNIFRRHNPDVRCIVAVPKLGWQRPSRSDIMPKAFDNLRSLRPVTNVLRELKQIVQQWRS